MPTNWYRVPSNRDGGEEPALDDFEAYSGVRLAASPQFIVRVTASPAALDDLESRPRVTQLPEATALALLRSEATVDAGATARSFRAERG